MSFLSPEFVIFFVMFIALYSIIPGRLKWLLILCASYALYAWDSVPFAGLLLVSTLVDFVLAWALTGTDDANRRKILFLTGVVLNLGALLVFKYLDFFVSIDLGLGQPLGISFYTFAKLAYLTDVYRGTAPAETNFGYYATFVSFFPNITSGPIERSLHFLPQLKQRVTFEEDRIVAGLRLILWGAFKKVIIAERLAVYVDTVYDQPESARSWSLLIATIFFAFQIYADFSGYTDMARGIAKLLGIDLFENFRQPYLATSILDFWRRWHISLTNLIREFMFLPLARALLRRADGRVSPRIIQATVYIVVMGIVGLWHGASWTFVIWGLLHGVFMGIEMLIGVRLRLPPKTNREALVRIGITFIAVSLAWIFFRADSLSDAWYVLTHLFASLNAPLESVLTPLPVDSKIVSLLSALGYNNLADNSVKLVQLGLSFALIGGYLWTDLLTEQAHAPLQQLPTAVRWAFYYIAIGVIFVSLSISTEVQEFVYVQF